MKRLGRKIRIHTEEWKENRLPYVDTSYDKWFNFPDSVMIAFLGDVRNIDYGTWVLAQVYHYQNGNKIDPARMASEGFEWEFYGDICRIIDAFDENRYFEIPLEDFAKALRSIRANGYAEEGVEITFFDLE